MESSWFLSSDLRPLKALDENEGRGCVGWRFLLPQSPHERIQTWHAGILALCESLRLSCFLLCGRKIGSQGTHWSIRTGRSHVFCSLLSQMFKSLHLLAYNFEYGRLYSPA